MRESPSSTPPFLTGSLLLAHPSMQDPNFRHSVVLISAHDENGAMGIVLNRPDGRRLGQLNTEFALSPLASVPLYQGGPIDTHRLVLCGWRFNQSIDGVQLMFGIDPDKAAELSAEGDLHLRAFLGYAGWSAGQLENELQQNTWAIAPLTSEVLQHPQDDTLWRVLLGQLDPKFKLFADEPDDPSRN